MNIRKLLQKGLLFTFPFLLLFSLRASEPEGYYKSAYGKSGYTLKTALYQIITEHTALSYNSLWDAYETTDKRADGKVWDMYSNCNFTFGSNQCGNYSQEGDCYNREHSFPKSWFDDATPMYTDLFHLYPTDGYVNGRRSNNPFGEVNNPTYTSKNGSKLGPNSTSGYTGTVFEPVDEYKGDFARSYFYMATCYENKIASWSSCPVCAGNNKESFKSWTVELLLKWHRQDPVSQKETDRNDAVYAIQKNRNPFIDHPELVEKIWGNDNTAFDPDNIDPVDPDPIDPDPIDPDPEDPNQIVYELHYEYTDGEGKTLTDDTVRLFVADNDGESYRNPAKSVLMDEDFPEVDDKEAGSPATVENTGSRYVETFNTVYTYGKSAVRLATSGNAGSLVFEELAVNGDFTVTISGKGWSESEREFTLKCEGCTQTSQTVTFTQSKADLSALDRYETLDPVTFTANGKARLTMASDAKKRVIIDRVTVMAVNGGDGPDNPDNPATDARLQAKVIHPLFGQTLTDRVLTAQVALKEETGQQHSAYDLPAVELAESGNYTLWIQLLANRQEVNTETILFSYKENLIPDNPDDPLTVATPVFSPAGGEVEKGAEVTIDCATEKATIYYTLDGSEPSSLGLRYKAPLIIDEAVTVKAVAMRSDYTTSAIAEASFTVKADGPDDPGSDTLGVKENPVRFSLYPNPSSGKFVVETLDESRVEIFTLQGVQLARFEGVRGRKEIFLRVSGMYVVRVTDTRGSAVQRVVIR